MRKQTAIFFPELSGQTTKGELLVGDWIEVRREQRSGYVYTIGGAFNEPSIELSFSKNGTGTFYNPQTPDPKSAPGYLLLGDTLLAWKDQNHITISDVETIDQNNLVIIIRTFNNRKSDDLDLKCYFIRKHAYSKLTKEEIDKLKAPSDKDKIYLDKINERRNRNKK
jgi:hypothetical protein